MSSSSIVDKVQYSNVWITCVLTYFLACGLQEIFERKLGMEPIIRRTKSLESQATSPSMLKMNRRLTRQLDHDGYFRVQTRGSVLYVKAIWGLATFILVLYIALSSDFVYQHFILFNPDTVYYPPLQHGLTSIVAYYSWELASNKYGKLNWSLIVHHWLSIFAAVMVLMGFYSPFSTWYGLNAISLTFPSAFVRAFRATHSSQYPECTRRMLKFVVYWYTFTIFLNFSGQIFLMVYGSIVGKVHYTCIIIIVCAMCGWMWTDFMVLRALVEFSNQRYEDAQIHRIAESNEMNIISVGV